MTARRAAAAGFTLIELLIALAIAVILLVLAAPAYSTWVADQQIRAGAESIAAGLRLAHAEAVRRNWQVEFVLNATSGSGGWTVTPVGGTLLQQGYFAEGSDKAQFAIAPAGTTTVTFDGLGRIVATNADSSDPLTRVAVTHGVSESRPLTVLVGGGRTGIKICDPAVSDTSSPRFCTAI